MKRIIILAAIIAMVAVAIPTQPQPAEAQSPTQLTLWRHETGDAEVNANIAAIERFNASQDQWEVVWETLPQGSYTESITAASLADDLPCIFDMDQPTVPNFAWSGFLVPLNQFIDEDTMADINPGGLGMYQGDVYSVGQFDVALAIFTLRSTLEEYDVRIPTLDEPWTREEFDAALELLAGSGEFDYALDLNAAWGGEWQSYGFAPFLQSFGGDLIDRESYLEAEGILNGDEAEAWGEWFANLFESGLADPSPVDGDGLIQGRVAIHYTGSWEIGRYTENFGDDLLFLPPPDFGNGPVIGAASWQWGISSSCDHPEGAGEFINFLMQPEEVAAMVEATSLIPTTSRGAALTENYAEGGVWRAFYEFSAQFALERPATPGYPIISSSFERAATQIRDGGDVLDALDEAVDSIERDIDDNGGYGF